MSFVRLDPRVCPRVIYSDKPHIPVIPLESLTHFVSPFVKYLDFLFQ